MSKKEIASWWAKNPMSYGFEHGEASYRVGDQVVATDYKDREFFENADRQFLAWNTPLHSERDPFGKIFPYEEFRGKKVLEVGCGMGFMSSLWAGRGADVTAVDLNPFAIEQTKHRFELFGLKGRIQQEDGNSLSLPSDSFDYVYSWGVLHHSPNLAKSISELFRVLKPGGKYGVMLYHRHSILHTYNTLYVEGFLHGEGRFLNPLELASRYGDGHRQEGNPHTWPITRREAQAMFSPFSRDCAFKIFGTELDESFRHLLPGVSAFIPKIAKKAWARRFGWSIWIYGTKTN